MNLPQTGGCQCGALRYEITQAPIMVYTCHCTDCQRMTSSAFSLGCVLPDGALRLVQGEPKGVQRTTGSGRVSTRWICPECGIWVCAAPRPGSTVRNVRGGTLDDTSWLRPTAPTSGPAASSPGCCYPGWAELRDATARRSLVGFRHSRPAEPQLPARDKASRSAELDTAAASR